jgi:predicted nucleic acid-binding protein
MNVVDSSAWLEYLVDSERASLFAEPIEQTHELIVPVLVIYELFKKVVRERGEQPAPEAYGLEVGSVSCQLSVVSCQRRRVEIRNSEWRRKRFAAPSASGQNVYFG